MLRALHALVVCALLAGCTASLSESEPAHPSGNVALAGCTGGHVGSTPNDARSSLFQGSPIEFAQRFLLEFGDAISLDPREATRAAVATDGEFKFDTEHGNLVVKVDDEGFAVEADYFRESDWNIEREDDFAWLVDRLTELSFESTSTLRAEDNPWGFALHQEVDGRDVQPTSGFISHRSDGAVDLSVRGLRHVSATEFMTLSDAYELAVEILGCTLERDGFAQYQVQQPIELKNPADGWAEEEVWGIDGRLAFSFTATVGGCGELQRTVYLDAEWGGVLHMSDGVEGCAYPARA